jgi:hypothetical protein
VQAQGGTAASEFRPFRRRESPVSAPVSAPFAEPAGPAPTPQAPLLERAKELGRALARVKAAEEQLQAAKAARQAMGEPEREWRITATYAGDEWLQPNRGGIPASPTPALLPRTSGASTRATGAGPAARRTSRSCWLSRVATAYYAYPPTNRSRRLAVSRFTRRGTVTPLEPS